MKRRKTKRIRKSGAPKWMVTYSDMVTLILVFFILLFSMSQIDTIKFDAISESFRNRMILDFFPSAVPMNNPSESSSHNETGKNSNEFDATSDFPNRDELDQDEIEKDDSLKDRKSTRLNSSHVAISYAVFCSKTQKVLT